MRMIAAAALVLILAACGSAPQQEASTKRVPPSAPVVLADFVVGRFTWSDVWGQGGVWKWSFTVKNNRDYAVKCTGEVEVLDGSDNVGYGRKQFDIPPRAASTQTGDTGFNIYEGARGDEGVLSVACGRDERPSLMLNKPSGTVTVRKSR